jgi:hypothetical protein
VRGGYQSDRFRECLRHEFAYGCAFCLLHSTDLKLHGLDFGSGRWGVWTVEHHRKKSESPELENDYSNCFWACRACNSGRGSRENVGPEEELLLEPRGTAWWARFTVDDGKIIPRPNDVDAAYTAACYDFNADQRLEMRRNRKSELTKLWTYYDDLTSKMGALSERLQSETSPAKRDRIRSAFIELVASRRSCADDLKKFCAIPSVVNRCACAERVQKLLPDWFAEQCRWLEEPA